MQGPDLEASGIPAPPNGEALEEFAGTMAEHVQLFTRHRETLAEALASAAVAAALREASVRRWRSAGAEMEELSDFLDPQMDPVTELHPLKDLRHHQHPGLPLMASLDYPDAPPTTPLLPELERSRRSFARKLKGGLAKVFLPSPPPTTPRERGDDACPVAAHPRPELLEHLMASLSTGEPLRDWCKAGAKVEAFAEALSSDVIGRAFRAGGGDVHQLAQQLAHTIVSASLGEAAASV